MTVLDQIVAQKRRRLAETQSRVPLEQLRRQVKDAPRPRFLAQSLRRVGSDGYSIIAELKKASPSAGLIRQDFDPLTLGKRLEAAGAAALSVLTEEDHFNGSLQYLMDLRPQTSVPLLRKDFILDVYQVYESRVCGADALLLIARILSASQMSEFLQLTHTLGMEALVEIHDEEDLTKAFSAGAKIVGVNQRNLSTFEKDPRVFERLFPLIPADCVRVAESGFQSAAELRQLADLGADAFLIGETLMRAKDPAAKLKELLSDEKREE